MTRSVPLPQTSPDGRFRIRVEETQDRSSVQVDTYLVECATRRDLAWIGNGVEAGFLPDGMVRVTRPAWNAHDVLIDPVQACFQVRADQPWLPLAAWGLAESAYRQGWANGLDFRGSDPAFGFPWVELWIALGAIAVVVFLAWKPWIDIVPRITLIIIAALVAALFVYLTATAWRSWRRAPDLRPSRR